MENTPSPAPPAASRAWWRHPLVPCGAVALALVAVGDEYPLTPFPMYSNIDHSADMLMVKNEKDEILPMSRLFNIGSAQGKKRLETELQKVAGTKDYEKTSPEQRAKAGSVFLTKLWEGRDKGDVDRLAHTPQRLRAVIRTVSMEGTKFKDEQFLMAEINVAQEGGAP